MTVEDPNVATHLKPATDIYRQIIFCTQKPDKPRVLVETVVKRLKEWDYRMPEDYSVLDAIEELGAVVIQVVEPTAVFDILTRATADKELFKGVDTNRPIGLTATTTQTPPLDPRYWEQWSFRKISAEPAWQRAASAPSVVVAIVDTGISTNHPDLQGHLWNDGAGHYGRNVLNGTYEVEDLDGHGSLLAGTIGAVSNNAVGIAAANWPIKLMAVKFHDVRTPPDVWHGALAIVWAVNHQAKIINAAWDVGLPHLILELAVLWADTFDVLFIAGAGNDGLDDDRLPTYPACYGFDNIIAVMASDEYDDKPGFSNYGKTTVHIGAPGVRILSTHPYFTGPRWLYYSGTSPACAHVAGAAALVLSLNSTGATPVRPKDLRTHLLNSADPAPWLACVAKGRLNFGRAVCGPLRVTSPKAGDVWQAGATVQTTWQNDYVTPLCSKVSILLSENGGPYSPFIDNNPNVGTCSVSAPARNIATAQLRLQSQPSTSSKIGLYTESPVFSVKI